MTDNAELDDENVPDEMCVTIINAIA